MWSEFLFEIISVIIDKAIAYKSGFLNSNVYLINPYGKPEDIQRLIENIADLKMDFGSILDLKNIDSLKGKSYEELVETFRYAKRINGNNITEKNITVAKEMRRKIETARKSFKDGFFILLTIYCT